MTDILTNLNDSIKSLNREIETKGGLDSLPFAIRYRYSCLKYRIETIVRKYNLEVG